LNTYFYCDDIDKTVVELTERGVEFTAEITEQEWGRVTRFPLPDESEVELYQPNYSLG
jgi:predicted enzyme related to lactoylglutathione lyase